MNNGRYSPEVLAWLRVFEQEAWLKAFINWEGSMIGDWKNKERGKTVRVEVPQSFSLQTLEEVRRFLNSIYDNPAHPLPIGISLSLEDYKALYCHLTPERGMYGELSPIVCGVPIYLGQVTSALYHTKDFGRILEQTEPYNRKNPQPQSEPSN